MVNGKKACDGDVLPTLGLTQCQPSPLEQQGCEKEESGGKKADKVSPILAQEQLSADLTDSAARIEDPLSREDIEMEGGCYHQQDHVEDARQNKGELVDRSMSSTESKKEDVYISLASDISTEQELRLLLKHMGMDGRTKGESLGEKVQQKQAHVPRGVKETLANPSYNETVCWDERVVVPDAKEKALGEGSEPTFTYPGFENQGQRNDVQVNWHFSTGPGLMEGVRCPLWQPPPMSYYPVLEPRGPFQGAG